MEENVDGVHLVFNGSHNVSFIMLVVLNLLLRLG
jgi:hypothetical protein